MNITIYTFDIYASFIFCVHGVLQVNIPIYKVSKYLVIF